MCSSADAGYLQSRLSARAAAVKSELSPLRNAAPVLIYLFGT